jgi:hypothetical protein
MMHPTHTKNAQGTQCVRCNVVDGEAAAKVPCPYQNRRLSDLQSLEQAKPLARTLIALAIYLRNGERGDSTPNSINRCYQAADIFMATLEQDYQ